MADTFAFPDDSQLAEEIYPTHTYRMDPNSRRIIGTVDGVDAIVQAVYKILSTERYAWPIYNWDYGVELEQYIGAGMDYVTADIKQTITEALLVDDRITAVDSFSLQKNSIDTLSVSFRVHSTKGNADITWEVETA